jgi:glycosyltransferase involved in cell wall biosynthesis
VNAWHVVYWHAVMAVIDLGVCHASTEVATYAHRFPRSAGKLVYIPFGTTVSARKDLLATRAPDGGSPVVVAAGRSGRDYRTLVEAITGLPCRLRIVCDADVALVGISRSEQVELVRDAFGDDYLRLLAGADVVVVPLAVVDVSAGQMVLLQAAALRRAVIITRTETTVDYATDEEDALLVPMGDVAALRQAIDRLLANKALRDRLGGAAASRFEREFSTEAYVRRLVAAIAARTPVGCVRH